MASPKTYSIALKPTGILGAEAEEAEMLTGQEAQYQRRLQGVLSEINGMAANSWPSSYHGSISKQHASSDERPEWPMDGGLDLEEEMAREELAKQRDARLRAEADLNMAPEVVNDRQFDNDETHETPNSRPQTNSSLRNEQARDFRSLSLVLEDNRLLGPASAEASRSSNRVPLFAPRTMSPSDPLQLGRGASVEVSSVASSSRRPARGSHETSIPKYIFAGHFSAVTIDGNVLRFERHRRLKGWKPPRLYCGEASTAGLLSRPVHQIIDAVRAREAEEIVAANEEAESRQAAAKRTPKPRREDDRIWIERYRPQRFVELLGDERVHREVMGWLKEWDLCVFRRKVRKHGHEGASVPFYAGPISYGSQHEDNDPYGRPAQRVLLISGAPGLGKTTLAHVLAKAAGYGVYELNASDARSSEAVTNTIRMALESASFRDTRPTCLVIDEIDGAMGGDARGEESRGFIKALVELVENGKGLGHGKRGTGKSKKGKKHKPVLRPIICICNDLYAPVLRPLRPHCRLIRFQKPAQNLLVTRLKTICEAESLSASSRSLSLLVELAQGDIRSCLNALQMAKHKRARLASDDPKIEISESDIREAGVGVKDGSTSLQAVWTTLFKTAGPKERARKTAPHDGPALTQHLVSLAQSSGEYTRLLQGCFEHYPNLHFADDGWWRIRNILAWADWGMELQNRAFLSSSYDLMAYVPYSFVKWHSLFANTLNSLPKWPKVEYENYLKRQAFDEIVVELHSALRPSLRAQFCRNSVVRELGPMLMKMLTPNLKSVNQQIAKPVERETVTHLVDIMLELSLSFVRDRTEDGNVVFRLEPPLEVFTTFERKQSAAADMSRYAIHQIVMKELAEEQIRRRDPEGIKVAVPTALEAYKQHEAKISGGSEGSKKSKSALDFFGRPIVAKAIKATPAVPPTQATGVQIETDTGGNDDSLLSAPILAARKARPAGILARSTANDYYDPIAAVLNDQGPSDQEHTQCLSYKRIKVHYRYNEGYSNAVRQPVKVSALL